MHRTPLLPALKRTSKAKSSKSPAGQRIFLKKANMWFRISSMFHGFCCILQCVYLDHQSNLNCLTHFCHRICHSVLCHSRRASLKWESTFLLWLAQYVAGSHLGVARQPFCARMLTTHQLKWSKGVYLCILGHWLSVQCEKKPAPLWPTNTPSSSNLGPQSMW